MPILFFRPWGVALVVLPTYMYTVRRKSCKGKMYGFDMHPSKRGGSQECPNCGACKESVEHVLSECASYDSQRQLFWTIYVHV